MKLRSEIWFVELGYWLIIALALGVVVLSLLYRPPVEVKKEEPCVEMWLKPAPKPELPRAPKPKEYQARLWSAGELVAYWDAWEQCKGETCID